jgi:hypothetical protein
MAGVQMGRGGVFVYLLVCVLNLAGRGLPQMVEVVCFGQWKMKGISRLAQCRLATVGMGVNAR